MIHIAIQAVLIYLFTFVCGQVYATLEGIREAYYYNSAVVSGDVQKFNLHSLFATQRWFVLGVFVVFLAAMTKDPYICCGLVCSSVLSFSFFHNGAYYMTRNNLNPLVYPKRFYANSKTSKAENEYSYISRRDKFIIGVCVFIMTPFIETIVNLIINIYRTNALQIFK